MNINRTSLRDRCRLATVGVDKHLATEPAIPVGDGVTKKAADVKAALQETINAADATQVARSQWIDASATEKAMRTSTLATLSALKTFVLLKFGSKDTATLADFGFSAPKQAQVTVDTKAAAVTKRAATRAARHTMGPLQKAKVTGATAATASAASTGTATTAPSAQAPAVTGPAAGVATAPHAAPPGTSGPGTPVA
jgi:hypothetical protein